MSELTTGKSYHPDADEGVLSAVVRTTADGDERYITYAPDVDPNDVDEKWLSVGSETPVNLVLWR